MIKTELIDAIRETFHPDDRPSRATVARVVLMFFSKNEFISGNMDCLTEAIEALDTVGANSSAEGVRALQYELRVAMGIAWAERHRSEFEDKYAIPAGLPVDRVVSDTRYCSMETEHAFRGWCAGKGFEA